MSGKSTAVYPPFGGLFLAQIARCSLLILQIACLDLFGFFKPKEKLILGKRLGPATDAMALLFLDDLAQPGILCLTPKHHFELLLEWL